MFSFGIILASFVVESLSKKFITCSLKLVAFSFVISLSAIILKDVLNIPFCFTLTVLSSNTLFASSSSFEISVSLLNVTSITYISLYTSLSDTIYVIKSIVTIITNNIPNCFNISFIIPLFPLSLK